MSTLTEASFSSIVEQRCACGSTSWNITSYVEGKLPLLEGETYGKLVWAYKGETFVDGIFELTCASCKTPAFTATECPRCHAAGGLAKALSTANTFPVPKSCANCSAPHVQFVAFVPASVRYVGKRAETARNHTALEDEGFHGLRVECKTCHHTVEHDDSCPLCASPGPLRKRSSGP